MRNARKKISAGEDRTSNHSRWESAAENQKTPSVREEEALRETGTNSTGGGHEKKKGGCPVLVDQTLRESQELIKSAENAR